MTPRGVEIRCQRGVQFPDVVETNSTHSTPHCGYRPIRSSQLSTSPPLPSSPCLPRHPPTWRTLHSPHPPTRSPASPSPQTPHSRTSTSPCTRPNTRIAPSFGSPTSPPKALRVTR
ncbi:hypothetical protein C8R44DRAFT_979119 [Mycena epipterygia]|nr:hypothetical protein C8R44DRAFT_979119 [Mycena epipterygia]